MANDYQPQKYIGNGTTSKTFTSISTDQDLRAQSEYPTHAPGRLSVTNDTDTPENLVWTDLRGKVNTRTIPQDSEIIIDDPVAAIDGDSGDNLEVTATWWIDSATRFNP